MNRRKEVCRNFQRGSCQYGDRCKFLHVSQQQSKPNPFGFGTQSTRNFPNTTQQQKPNPFGFGVQNNTQLQNNTHSKGSQNFGSRYQNPVKPFENKWTRTSSTNATSSQQTESQPQASVHKCTDPESCKRQIVEDFKNEAPLWKLTCYGHRKNGPCDIVGDISFEELRAAAYEDAKQGLSIQSIVDRERSLYLSKLNEFDNLLKKPCVSQNLSSPRMGQSPMSNDNVSANGQSNAAPSFSSFSQLKAATNLGPTIMTNPPSTLSGTNFGQPSPFQNTSQNSVGFGMKFGTPGVFGQKLTQPSGSSPSPSISTFNVGVRSTESPFPVISQQFGGINNQQPNSLMGSNVSSLAVQQASLKDEQEVIPDDSIWLKEEWKIGEIPERPPPDKFC